MLGSNIKTDIRIADDTINMIAGVAATSVDGVVSLGEGITFKALPFIGSNNLKKGVIIEKNERDGSIVATVTIVIRPGVDIKKICLSIQEKVKDSIESMLDLVVKEVIVKVAKIDDV